MVNAKNKKRQIFLNNGSISISFVERHSIIVKTIAIIIATIKVINPISYPHKKLTDSGTEKNSINVVISAALPNTFTRFLDNFFSSE